MFQALLIVAALFLSTPQVRGDSLRTFGLMGGASFPRFFVLKAQINFSESWAMDAQGSLGSYWTTQQGDILYFFNRSDWSVYTGVGYQFWQFKGISLTNESSFFLGSGDLANSLTVPLGLQYVDAGGFVLDFSLAIDVFINGFSGLKSRIMPEAQILLGYFF